MTLVAWKRNPHCFLLRVGGGGGVHVNRDINHATDQPQACPCLLLYIVQISFQVSLSLYFYLILIYLYLQ